MASIVRRYFSPIAAEKPTVGDTKTSLVESDHLGWLKCDGRLLNVSDYYFLYQLIGNTYGGNSRTFNLPNPAGQVIGIIGSGVGLTTRAYGASVGEETHVLTIPEMPTHNHNITDPGHNHTYTNQPNTASPAVSLTTMDVASNSSASQNTGNKTTGITINNTGGSQAHNNMQPTLFVGNLFIFSGKIEKTNFPFMVSKLY